MFENISLLTLGASALFIIIAVAAILAGMSYLRRVVPTNMVHIVQSRSQSTSYGYGNKTGNVYYRWPSGLPFIGVTVTELPINNFEVPLNDYVAYDKDRVPFILDVCGFFVIGDTNVAAAKCANIDGLKKQLTTILQGSIRSILAQYDINQIMADRSTFGTAFTKEVEDGLQQWGVRPVRNIELMDIRDAKDSNVIHNIMSMKTADIQAKSRIAVATANQEASSKEITTKQQLDLQNSDAERSVQERNAANSAAVGIASQQSKQQVLEQENLTVTKQQEVARTKALREAEIASAAAIVLAEQQKQTAILAAQASLEAKKLAAEVVRVQGQADADAVRVQGEAAAAAETAKLMAPVTAQVELANKLGANEAYQNYLLSIKNIEAQLEAAKAQAAAMATALSKAEVKIIANTGSANEGLKSASQLFTSQGGTALGTMLEGLNNTPQGAQILKAVKSFSDNSDK